jgi:hypothetical protein
MILFYLFAGKILVIEILDSIVLFLRVFLWHSKNIAIFGYRSAANRKTGIIF